MKKLLLILLLFSLLLLSGCSHNSDKYNQLFDEYSELQSEYSALYKNYDDLQDFLFHIDGPMSNLYLYFEEKEISFDEAYKAFILLDGYYSDIIK